MKSPMGGGQHGIIPGSPGCRSNISQTSPGSGTLEVAPRSRWDVSAFKYKYTWKLHIGYMKRQI